MRQHHFIRLFAWNLGSLRLWQFLLVIAMFVSIGLFSASEVRSAMQNANVWHAVLLSFAGPGVWGVSLPGALIWLVPHLLFFYLIGNIANEELMNRGYAILPLIGARRSWWWGKLTIILFISLAYILLWFLVVFLGAVFVLPCTWITRPFLNSGDPWPFSSDISIFEIFTWIFCLYTSTLLTLSLAQIAISVWWRRSFHAYVFIVIVTILSWLLGTDLPELARWLPGSQSMLSRHTFLDPSIPNFTFEWSLLYNGFIFLITLGLSLYHIRRLDIFGNPVADIR